MPLASRDDLKQYCLRQLGHPVIKINVDDDQVNDRIDEAIQKYQNYHYDGSEKVYIRYQITDQNKIDKWLPVANNILGISDIFDIGASYGTDNIFSIRYQIIQNDLYNLTSVSMVPYYMAMQHIQLLEQLLVGKQPLRYNMRTNRLYIDQDWNLVNTGDYIVAIGDAALDPEVHTGVYDDMWLKLYTTSLIKRQYGQNLKKFNGVNLPGGVQFNGQQIYNEAVQEIKELDKRLMNDFCNLPFDMLG